MEGVTNATPPPHYFREADPAPSVQEAGWATGPVWTSAENPAFNGIRSPDRRARSESIHRFIYPCPPLHLGQKVVIDNRGPTNELHYFSK